MEKQNQTNNGSNKEIIKTWLAGSCSCTLVIPKDFAREYGLDQPSHVVIEQRPEGMLIRKLELSEKEDGTQQ